MTKVEEDLEHHGAMLVELEAKRQALTKEVAASQGEWSQISRRAASLPHSQREEGGPASGEPPGVDKEAAASGQQAAAPAGKRADAPTDSQDGQTPAGAASQRKKAKVADPPAIG